MLAYLITNEGSRFELIGTSVLIIAESSDAASSSTSSSAKVKLIDFAHSNIVSTDGCYLNNMGPNTAHRKKIYRDGITYGLRNLIDDLKHLLIKDKNYNKANKDGTG
jgi:hypothetical protein